MKKTTFLILLFLLSVTPFLYSQPADIINKTQFVNGNEGVLGPQCVDGLVYDDNSFENGIGFNAGFGIVKYVMKMSPTAYPYLINQVCLALSRLANGSANWTYDIVVYDTTGTGGSPGNLVTTIANQTVTSIPIFPSFTWYDFTGITTIPQLNGGSYYVGISWDPNLMPYHYIGQDETGTTPLRVGYRYTQGTWTVISGSYKAMGVRVSGIIVGVQNNHNGIPDKFSLEQNYPNPFNPVTSVKYSIPKQTNVKLIIFDALGREVVLLVNEKQSAGSYGVEWDGTNYSSGQYFYKLECDEFTDVKKMVLIK